MFDYLDGCDIYQAFGGLNNHFDNLLSDPSLFLKINLLWKSERELEGLCRDIILPNRYRLRSLKLSDHSIIDKFFNYNSIDSSFTSLQSVVLYRIYCPRILAILRYLNYLPCLFSLTIMLKTNDIRERYYSRDVNDMYRLIFRCPHLKYCKLFIPDYEQQKKCFNKAFQSKSYRHPTTDHQPSFVLLRTLSRYCCSHLPYATYLARSCFNLVTIKYIEIMIN